MSKFYDMSDGLEPHVVEILNTKLEHVKEYFVGQLQLITHHTDCLRQNVALMESMNKEGMRFVDLDTERLIKRIVAIEEVKRDQNAVLRKVDPS